MKRTLIILFLTTILYNNVFYYIGFKVRQNFIKSEAREETFSADLSDKELSIIKITHSQEKTIKWIEQNEVLINNQLFDVFKKMETKDSIILYCKEDVKEFKLISEFIDFIEKQFDQNANTSTNKSPVPITKFFENLIPYSNPQFSFQRLFTYSIQLQLTETSLYVNSVIRDILQPPQL